MKPKILIAEDCPITKNLFQRSLENDYDLDFCERGLEALQKIADNDYDMFLLDIMLPEVDGYKIFSEIKNKSKNKDKPVFFITSKDTEQDLLLGFQIGANDYIKKPFSPLELKARVDVHLKKIAKHTQVIKAIEFHDIKVDLESKRFFLKNAELNSNDWVEQKLTSIEFKILQYFLTHQDHLLSRDQIMDAIWNNSTHVSQRTVDTHISKLKKKLKHAADYIEAVYSEGYRFSFPSSKKKTG